MYWSSLTSDCLSWKDDHDPAAIADDSVETCKRVGALLGVDNDCFKNALMSTTTITRGEAIVRPYTTSQAIGMCRYGCLIVIL